MESNEQLDGIMKCSKEAIARAYMCREMWENSEGCHIYDCGRGCLVRTKCYHHCNQATPQDWQKVLDERNGGEACITE